MRKVGNGFPKDCENALACAVTKVPLRDWKCERPQLTLQARRLSGYLLWC